MRPKIRDMSAPTCVTAECVVIRMPHPVRHHPRTAPAKQIDFQWVCITCMGFPGHRAIRMHDDDLTRFQVPSLVGQEGGMRAFGLPTFSDISAYAGVTPIVTDPAKRIDSALRPDQLQARLTNLLNFGRRREPYRRFYPHAVPCPSIGHPAIVHIGLVDKITMAKPDEHHYRFAGYIFDAISQAIEGWLCGEGTGHPTYHLFAMLRTADNIHTMMVVVDAESHIVDTAYIIDNTQEDKYRVGRLVFLTWGLG